MLNIKCTFFFFFGHARSMQKLPGQRRNHGSDNAKTLSTRPPESFWSLYWYVWIAPQIRKDDKHFFFLTHTPRKPKKNPFWTFFWIFHVPFKLLARRRQAHSWAGPGCQQPPTWHQRKQVGGGMWLLTSSGHTLLFARQSHIVASVQNTPYTMKQK